MNQVLDSIPLWGIFAILILLSLLGAEARFRLGRYRPENDRSVMVGLFIQSLNEVIDIHTKRVATGLVHRIPEVIWITLFNIGLLGTAVIGYRAGLAGPRGNPAASRYHE